MCADTQGQSLHLLTSTTVLDEQLREMDLAERDRLRAKWHILVEGDNVVAPIKTFKEMKFPQPMLAALDAKGIKRPTPIQVSSATTAYSVLYTVHCTVLNCSAYKRLLVYAVCIAKVHCQFHRYCLSFGSLLYECCQCCICHCAAQLHSQYLLTYAAVCCIHYRCKVYQ
jgi:hypothetical protein